MRGPLDPKIFDNFSIESASKEKMAQTKFNMIGNIVEILEKFRFLMSKGFSPPFQAFDWDEKGLKMTEKTEKSL